MAAWCCGDCLILLANGETPPELDEEATAAWLAKIDARSTGGHWFLGLRADEHDDDCPNVDHETGAWLGSSDCYCESHEFSWSPCVVCGSSLGGSRHAVTLFEVTATDTDQVKETNT